MVAPGPPTAPAASGADDREEPPAVELRPLEGWEEYRACETFQRRIWGEDFTELAPASLQKIAQTLGGVASGAFDPEEGLVGFVFGLTGLEDGEPVHWSHMLAVRRDFRDRGVGRRLKEHQRELLLEEGVDTVYWTFDPLVARNAHFNLNRLGVRVEEYVPQMYGDTASRLHEGLGTDRFLVAWDLESYRPPGAERARPAGEVPGEGPGRAGRAPDTATGASGPAPSSAEDADTSGPAPDGVPAHAGLPSRGSAEGTASAPPIVRVEIPADIHAVREEDPAAAAEWRERTRDAFLSRLDAGYRVMGFVPGPDRAFYVLVRQDVEPGGVDLPEPAT
jgi:predicted GNAT superfamily acetyltransferase